MDNSLTLHAIEISGPVMIARGALNMPNGGGKLFVGNGIAYVAAANTIFGGYATASVSDRDNLTLISGAKTGPPNLGLPNSAIIANGSGTGLLLGMQGSTAVLDVMNASHPANTTAFVTRFLLPAPPFDAAIASGIAFVADGNSGLQVVNYRPFDNKGVAPVVSITSSSTKAVEGSLVPVHVQVSDDVQARNVELLVNGQVVLNDVSFPFDLIAAMPLLSAGTSNVVLQARATDTGGNIALSNPLAIQLVPDTTPPTILSIAPTNHSTLDPGVRAVTISFSEPLDETTLTDQTIQLVGAEGAVSPENIQFRAGGAEVQFIYPALSVGDYQMMIDGAAVKDRAGNALSSIIFVSAFAIQALTTAQWTNAAGGFWDDPANWESGALPGPTDQVIIAVPGKVTVTLRQGTTTIYSLVSSNPFTMIGGTLVVASTIEVDSTLTLSGGKIVGGTLRAGSGGGIVVSNVATVGGMTFDGLTLAANLTVLASTLTVTNGMTMNGATLLLASSNSREANVLFWGTQALEGAGEVIFAGSDIPLSPNHLYINGGLSGAATLTIGPGITIHGTASGNVFEYGRANSIVNLGTISADTAGHMILFGVNSGYGKTAVNLGKLQAINGGTLTAQVLLNQGYISAGDGSTLTLQKSWSNAGTIAATNAIVNLGSQASTFTLANLGTFHRSGGDVFLTGTLDNRGTTLALDATTGSWILGALNKSGTIKGGTVTATGGAGLLIQPVGSGNLNGVTLATDLVVPDSASLVIDNGLTLSNATVTLGHLNFNCSSLLFEGTQTLGGTGQILFESSCSNLKLLGIRGAGPPALTISPGIILQGTQNETIDTDTASASLINQGTILVNSHLFVRPDTINQGTIQAQNGGSIVLHGAVLNSGQLTPGNPPQLLTVSGSYTQLATGVLNIHVGGKSPGTGFSQLQAGGPVALDGTLNLTLINNFSPNVGDTFELLTFGSGMGQFATVNGLNISSGKAFQAVYTTTNLTLTVITP